MCFDFRDFAFISSIKSRKYCERVDPVTRTVSVTAAGEEVPSIEYGDTPLEARHHAELADNEMYVWLRAAGAGPAEVRLVVTPVRRRCSSLDVWWTPCSGGAGPCVRRDLLCDGIVNCGGQQLRAGAAGDEAGATCRTRVQAAGAGADTGQWLVPSFIVFVASSVAGTGALLCCCSHLRRTKPRAEQRGDSGADTAACYTEASAPPALGTQADTEDSPPSYEEAVLLLRRP